MACTQVVVNRASAQLPGDALRLIAKHHTPAFLEDKVQRMLALHSGAMYLPADYCGMVMLVCRGSSEAARLYARFDAYLPYLDTDSIAEELAVERREQYSALLAWRDADGQMRPKRFVTQAFGGVWGLGRSLEMLCHMLKFAADGISYEPTSPTPYTPTDEGPRIFREFPVRTV